MIGKRHEYVQMAAVEAEHWWFRYLHSQVRRAIVRHAGLPPTPAILDAGCGTGGLLRALQQAGYTALQGFDASADAVDFAQQTTGLPIGTATLQQSGHLYTPGSFQVVCCMDVFTYLSDEEIVAALQQFAQWLPSGGIIITNNNAFRAFKGTHDYQVGIIKRFVKSDFASYAQQAGLHVLQNRYWNFYLSPLVWAIRKWKLLQVHSGLRKASAVTSDLAMPSPWINQRCYQLLQAEEKTWRQPPWGTSVFTVLQKP